MATWPIDLKFSNGFGFGFSFKNAGFDLVEDNKKLCRSVYLFLWVGDTVGSRRISFRAGWFIGKNYINGDDSECDGGLLSVLFEITGLKWFTEDKRIRF